MNVRKAFAAALTASVTGSVVVLTAGAAHAATDPDDTTFTPVATDVIGVGSDTSQNALFRIANAYNATNPTNKLATFAATGGGTITLPNSTPTRPNGSGSGKNTLYNPSNPDIDFARSSSTLSDPEIAAGLRQFPFALDTLKMAVSGQVASHAPASLTPAQIVGIYDGTFTNWDQVGGTAGVIAPKIPQAGSGTRSFFEAQLKAANNGVAVTLAGTVAAVQEHDPAPIQGDNNAIAPFSAGRAGLAGGALRLPGGFSADRALYNVVRSSDLGNTDIQALFGEEGFLCDEAARASIEAAGFKQLATPEKGGVCGSVTQAATTDFTINTGPAEGDDTTFIAAATDVIGVGSDTSQHALKLIANSYNAGSPAHKLATFAATGGGQIPLPTAAINRPNGSGAGKTTLYNPSNPDVDFARSSSSLNDAEVAAQLQQFPFALDTLKLAVSGQVTSNAPTAITPAQMVGIYDGSITNWATIGGTSGTIKPLIPQAGSGTRSFFEAQLKAANNGVAVTLAGSVVAVQEHDPAPIQGDANAVAPFSAGRAGLDPGKLRLETGFSADRALYNVVRAADLANTDIQAIFGEDGFVCSDGARDEIEAAGFKQLDSTEDGGVCGQATQVATTNFKTNDPVVTIATQTALTATSPAAKAMRLVATVTATPTPTGTVEFFNAATSVSLGSAALIGGTATLNLANVAPGAYAVRASYTPTVGSDFLASESPQAGVKVKATSSIIESFASSVAKTAKSAKGTVTVKLAGLSTKPTGKVTIKEGSKTVGTGTLSGGKVTIILQRSKVGAGKSTLKITWPGDANGVGSSKTFTITFKK